MIDKVLASYLADIEKSPEVVAQAVAIVIRTAQQAIEATGLTEADVRRLLERQSIDEAIGPMLDPTTWLRRAEELHADGKEIRKRAQLVQQLMALPVRGEGGLVDAAFTAAFGGPDGIKSYIVAPLPADEAGA